MLSLLYPRARFVHCLRDARATGLSIFMQNFPTTSPGGVNSGLEYAADMQAIADVTAAHDDLMAHWPTLGIEIHEVSYESLVSPESHEAEVRALLKAVGLPFEAQCLRHNGSGRVASTASARQVREGLHTRSVA